MREVTLVANQRKNELATLFSDVEKFVNFAPNGPPNRQATDFEEDPHKAPKTYYNDDMPGVVVRYMYVKPVFRTRIRVILRDVLRHTSGEVLLFPAGEKTDVYSPLINGLVLCPPRRIMEFATSEPPIQSKTDVEPLMVLHASSRKLLSDMKTQINARIVVVGGSTTGTTRCTPMLSFIEPLTSLNLGTFICAKDSNSTKNAMSKVAISAKVAIQAGAPAGGHLGQSSSCCSPSSMSAIVLRRC